MQQNLALKIGNKTKQRVLGWLAAAVTIGVFAAAPQQANAAAFVWIAGNNFAYSAAACATPGAAFYAWFLAVGPNATTAAWTACSGPVGSSASFSIARARVGGGGAAWAVGFADPWAGIETGTTLSGFEQDSSNWQTDSNNSSSEFSTPYTFDTSGSNTTGITLDSNANDNALNGLDTLTAYLYTGSEDSSTLCTALGGTNCSSSQTTSTGDVTDLSTLSSDLNLTQLGTESDPNGLGGSTLNFNQNVSDSTQIILVGQGDAEAASAPEPVSISLIGAGLCGLGVMRRRRKA